MGFIPFVQTGSSITLPVPVADGGTGAATAAAAATNLAVLPLTGGTLSGGLGMGGNTLTNVGADAITLPFLANMFGTGSDGAVTFDGTTTYAAFTTTTGVAPNLTYTLTRDLFATTLSLSSGITLLPNGFRIFASTSSTLPGIINAVGGNASGATGGASPVTVSAIFRGSAGATGTTGAGAQGSAGGVAFACGNSGAGGSGSGGAGGSQRTGSAGTWAYQNPFVMLTGVSAWATASNPLSGAPGAASGGGDGSGSGGGGGGGGGIVTIASPTVNGTGGTITVAGGNGGNGGGTNCGGGGGGGGGAIVIYTLSAWTAGTTTVSGGTHGTKTGTGNNGSDGTSGSVVNVLLS